MILVCHVMSPVFLYVEVSLSAVRRLWAGAARLEVESPHSGEASSTSSNLLGLLPTSSKLRDRLLYRVFLRPFRLTLFRIFTDISPIMADPRESSSYSVIPRIRYNTVGGVNGPLVILENVRRHAPKLESAWPV